MLARFWMVVGALLGMMAVAMAAYASHGVPPDRAGLAMTGAQIGAWHALALLATGLLLERRRGVVGHLAAACFALGSVGFCAGVWLRALTEFSIGIITPIGGMLLLAGWLLLAVTALGRDR